MGKGFLKSFTFSEMRTLPTGYEHSINKIQELIQSHVGIYGKGAVIMNEHLIVSSDMTWKCLTARKS